MDFSLPSALVELQHEVREWVTAKVRPAAADREPIADPYERFPWDWVEALSGMGVRTLALPREFGGWGGGALACCVIGEELGAGDLGLAVALDQTWKLTPLVSSAATPENRARFLDAFIDDPRFLMGAGGSEASAGSDQTLPYNAPGAGARATAVRDGDHWVLNGEKEPITNAGVGRLHILNFRTVPGTGGGDGLTAFYCPKGTPGYTVPSLYDKGGQRLGTTGVLRFEQCRLPADQILGEPGQAGAAMGRLLKNRGFPQAGAGVLGVARAAWEDATAFAKQRVQGGAPIINHPNVAIMLAEMQASIEAARSLIWRAAWQCDRDGANDGRLQIQAKIVAAETAFRVTEKALRVFGRWATLRGEYPVDKHLRDASSFLHSDGQNETLLLKLTRMAQA
jgi:alkylation response protein AidB-like acyl-CoA dehydrogenase